jgi:hypothetical protein
LQLQARRSLVLRSSDTANWHVLYSCVLFLYWGAPVRDPPRFLVQEQQQANNSHSAKPSQSMVKRHVTFDLAFISGM